MAALYGLAHALVDFILSGGDSILHQLMDWQNIAVSLVITILVVFVFQIYGSIRNAGKSSFPRLQSIRTTNEKGEHIYRNANCHSNTSARPRAASWSSLSTQAKTHVSSSTLSPLNKSTRNNGFLVRSPSKPSSVETLHESFQTALHMWPHRKMLLEKDQDTGCYSRITTYAQAGERVTRIGSGLVQQGLNSQAMVGSYCTNCAELVLLELGAWSYSLVVVPVHDLLEIKTVRYIIHHSEMTTIACSLKNIPRLLEALVGCPLVSTILLLNGDVRSLTHACVGDSIVVSRGAASRIGEEEEAMVMVEEREVRILTLSGLEREGNAAPMVHRPPRPMDLASVIYTASPSGRFHGAMLSHGNYIASVAGLLRNGIAFTERDTHVSYLPMAHVYERVVQCSVLYAGGSIGFAHKNELFSDVAALKPTIFVGVPRLYNRLYRIILDSVAWKRGRWGLLHLVFRFAYYHKSVYLRYGLMRAGLWDTLLFSRVRRTLGGRVRLMASGSAPISPSVLTFLRVCFSCEVLEGYGQTETCGTTSITHIGDYRTGHVGPPMPCSEVKLVDVPEMRYTSKDKPYARGEICVRGPNVFLGYLKNPRKTAKVLDADGWLKSGDVGHFNPNGTLVVLNQRKSMFKLAQGEYIMPHKIEAIYGQSRYVRRILVCGNPLSKCIVAIVVVRHAALLEWAEANIAGADKASMRLEELCLREDVIDAVMSDMHRVGVRSESLRSYEMVAAVALRTKEFPKEVFDATRSKFRRHEAKRMFQRDIDALYAKIPSNVHIH